MASVEQVVLFDYDPESSVPDAHEVSNYVRTMHYGWERLKSLPISLRLIEELHARLLEGVRGGEYPPGGFRRDQNYIRDRLAGGIEQARFIPPPPNEMKAALYDFERFLTSPCPFPIVVQLALAHYQFEVIHPFPDGNGRIGRLLLPLVLCERGVLSHPLLYLSAFFERRRNEYYDHLLKVSQAGTWGHWIEFFLQAVKEQALDAIVRSTRLLEQRETYRRELQTTRSSALLLKLIDELFVWPAITVTHAQKVLGVATFETASRTVDKLVRAGVLREWTGHRRNRVFIAPAIIDIIESDSAEDQNRK